jgi:hypothetical protein
MPTVKELAARFATDQDGAAPTPSKFEAYAKKEVERERRHQRRKLRGRHSHDGRRRRRSHRGHANAKQTEQHQEQQQQQQQQQQQPNFARELAAKTARLHASKLRDTSAASVSVKTTKSKSNTSDRRKSMPGTHQATSPPTRPARTCVSSTQHHTTRVPQPHQQPLKAPGTSVAPPARVVAHIELNLTRSATPPTPPLAKPRNAFLAPPESRQLQQRQRTHHQATIGSKLKVALAPATSAKLRKPSAVVDVLGNIGARLQRKARRGTENMPTRRLLPRAKSTPSSGIGPPPTTLTTMTKPLATTCPLFLNVPVERAACKIAPPPGLECIVTAKPANNRLSHAYRRRVSLALSASRHGKRNSDPQRINSVASVQSSQNGDEDYNSSDEELVELPVRHASTRSAPRHKKNKRVAFINPAKEPVPQPVAMQPLGLSDLASNDNRRASLSAGKRVSIRRSTTRPQSMPRRSGMSGITSGRMSASTFGIRDRSTAIRPTHASKQQSAMDEDWAVRLSRGISCNFGGHLRAPIAREHVPHVFAVSPASVPWYEDVAVKPITPATGSLASLATDPWLLDDVEQYELSRNIGHQHGVNSRLSQQRDFNFKRRSVGRRVVSAPRNGFSGWSAAMEAVERREAALQADVAAFIMAKDPAEFTSVSQVQDLVARCAIGKMVESLKHTFDDTPPWWESELASQIVDVV